MSEKIHSAHEKGRGFLTELRVLKRKFSVYSRAVLASISLLSLSQGFGAAPDEIKESEPIRLLDQKIIGIGQLDHSTIMHLAEELRIEDSEVVTLWEQGVLSEKIAIENAVRSEEIELIEFEKKQAQMRDFALRQQESTAGAMESLKYQFSIFVAKIDENAKDRAVIAAEESEYKIKAREDFVGKVEKANLSELMNILMQLTEESSSLELEEGSDIGDTNEKVGDVLDFFEMQTIVLARILELGGVSK